MGRRKGEKQCERETLVGCLSYAPQPGTESATQACALTESYPQPFSLWGDTQPTEPHWSQLEPTLDSGQAPPPLGNASYPARVHSCPAWEGFSGRMQCLEPTSN